VKRYEGLFILNLAGKEEGIKEVVDRVSADIDAAGGKVETVQKMDKKAFARVADRRISAGHYVNVIFAAGPKTINLLQTRFAHAEDIHRVLFTEASAVPTTPVIG
jgi:ribosomal protein S6